MYGVLARLGKICKATTLLVAVTLLTSCSQSFLYEYIPRFALWEVDDYVDLDSSQSQELLTTFRELLEVHRQDHLPFYVEQVEAFRGDVISGGMSAQDVESWYYRIDDYRHETFEYVAPYIVSFVQSLSVEQRQEMIDSFRSNQRESDEKYAERSEEKRLEKLKERRVEDVEELVGELSNAQIALLEESAEKQLDSGQARRAWRSGWLDQFEEAIQQEAWTRVEALVAKPDATYPPEYVAILESNRELGFEVTAQVINSLSDDQKQLAEEKLLEYRVMFTTIMANAG